MGKPPKEQNLLYHFTSTKNLYTIFKEGLKPRSSIENFCDVADNDIIKYRKEVGLSDYIPFHFFAPTPFVGAVQQAHPDENFVFICIYRSYAQKHAFKILPIHPLSHRLLGINQSKLYTYDKGFAKINWDKMAERDYGDEECKCICMAECLTKDTIFYNDFFCIEVQNKRNKELVKKIFKETVKKIERPPFHIDIAEWFFKKNA